MTIKDIFKITDPDLQTLVGEYNDLYKVRVLLMTHGIVTEEGSIDVDKFGTNFVKLDEQLTEAQGKSIAETINTFLNQE